MKYEWKKSEKELYAPKEEPIIINIGKQKFLTIEGKGNPNNKEFQKRVEALYSLAYAVRMMPRNGFTPNGYFEYTVYPLEGTWDLTEKGRGLEKLNKDELVYKIMIRQPEFVNEEVIAKAFEIASKKKLNELHKEVKFEEIEDGMCAQILHVGTYDDEPRSFAKLNQYIDDNNYEKRTLVHKEIYLSDPRKVEQAKLKTILRCYIKKK